MKKYWEKYKKIFLFRKKSESLRLLSKKLDQYLFRFLDDNANYQIDLEKKKVQDLVDEFIQYLNEYEVFILYYTSMNPEKIRKLIWESKNATFEEHYAITNSIFRFMHSIQDGNIIVGLGKKELIAITIFIVVLEVLLYTL